MLFAQDIAEHIVHDRPIIYFDETTLNSWCAIKKTWYFKDQKFIVPVNSDRGKNFTIYGSVGACLINQHSYFEIHDKTNKIDFMSYIENLGTQIRPGLCMKPWLILDNHRAHVGKDRMLLMERFFEVKFTPPYSCELNQPIESTWSTLKSRVLPKFTKL